MDSPRKVVEAEEFVLKNSDGKVRARLAQDENGVAALRLYDGNGTDRLMIGVPEEGDALIALGDGQGQPRIVLSEVAEGVGLQLRDSQGRIRANLLVQEHISALSFQNDQGEPRLTLASNPDTAFLALYDQKGALVMGIRVDPNGNPQIVTERLGDILSVFGNEPEK